MRTPTLVVLAVLSAPLLADEQKAATFSFQQHADALDILVDGQRFATYVWSDPVTTRPYFKQVCAADGTQLTRRHPPGSDEFDDHGTFHPGIWWGFGDVGGNDYWRLKTKIIGGDFVEPPRAKNDRASFAVRNRMLNKRGEDFCLQTCRYEFVKQRHGILLICEIELLRESSDFWLGDQEEMGLAVRVTKAITAKASGKIVDSEGRTERNALRTHQADWCDYSGTLSGKFGGITLMNDPANFRKPWWHNVDTGLLVANPLGQSELSGKGKRRENIRVKANTPFRLRYGILLHTHRQATDFRAAEAYADFVKLLSVR